MKHIIMKHIIMKHITMKHILEQLLRIVKKEFAKIEDCDQLSKIHYKISIARAERINISSTQQRSMTLLMVIMDFF